MTKSESNLKSKLRSKGLRRLTARFALFIGAIGSFGFMIWAIYNNDSVSWLILYSLWVMSPFFALFFTKMAIQSKLVLSNKTLYNLMIFISMITLIIYLVNAISPLSDQQELIFQIVPLACWLIILIILLNAFLKSRKKNVTP